jgi:heme A synthase
MTRLLWILLRFSLCAWIGAATLFVVTGIRVVTSDLFEPVTKNQLAELRFPAYYLFGFVLVGTGTGAAGLLSVRRSASQKRLRIVLTLCLTTLAIMLVDYLWIYSPLADLMSQPDARNLPEFAKYHTWSKWINVASLSTCLLAAMMTLVDGNNSTENHND